jgi:hypothetical protein
VEVCDGGGDRLSLRVGEVAGVIDLVEGHYCKVVVCYLLV